MRILLIKTSSLGDVIHALPAVTDAARAVPDIRFDWVVEEAFAEIPAWHPAVERVVPVALRRWRQRPFARTTRTEWKTFRAALDAASYDFVLDAQGLIKSAWLAVKAHVPVHGLDFRSAREPLASLAYAHRYAVPWGRHAVRRLRELFSASLGYPLPEDAKGEGDGVGYANAVAYGLDCTRMLPDRTSNTEMTDGTPRLVFLHGTTWHTKHWPESYWRELARLATQAGWEVRLPWGSETERERAQQIAKDIDGARVLPRLPLAGLAVELAAATACVGVDSGLGHLAAALDVPTLSLFGPTNPGLTGAWGHRQRYLATDFPCAPCLRKTCSLRSFDPNASASSLSIDVPCFVRLAPARVWEILSTMR
ncbi:MAG: lipopolysaccharide heptosyltransferase I [Betaproteobacteria bacterium]|nr:lipopolysaccharide heptosyltransferase I [Betaproteobacteria bacterium]